MVYYTPHMTGYYHRIIPVLLIGGRDDCIIP